VKDLFVNVRIISMVGVPKSARTDTDIIVIRRVFSFLSVLPIAVQRFSTNSHS
jgi:hypothetical protein